MQYQFLQTNITRAVWQTVRRITNEILGVKRLIIIAYSHGAIIWNGFFIIAAIIKLVELLSALLSALLLFHRVLDLWFVLQEAVAISIRLVSLLHFVMKSNKKMVVTHAPLPLLPPPPPTSILSAPVCRNIHNESWVPQPICVNNKAKWRD